MPELAAKEKFSIRLGRFRTSALMCLLR